ncbi:hypothetical protein D3C71_1559780 [compost metagenome]
MEENGKPGSRSNHMHITAQMNAERCHQPAFAPPRHCLRRGIEHRRAGNIGEHRSRDEEGDQQFDRWHRVILGENDRRNTIL